MKFFDDLLTILIYIMAAVSIVSVPIILIAHFIKSPLDHILKSIVDARYREVDNAMRATERITLDDGTIILKRYKDGVIDYETIHEPRHVATAQVGQGDAPPNAAAIDSARWIVASYSTLTCDKQKHRHGPDGDQLLTEDECLAKKLFTRPQAWQDARDWMLEQWLIAEHNGGGNPGTFTKRPLSEMLDVLTALPQRKM